jgi:Domain of unknown function (DUF5076)
MFGLRKPPLDELPVPPEARSDEEARELIRAWAAHRGLHLSLRENSWGDNERVAWGALLMDVIRQIANAMHEQKGWDKIESMREIIRVLNEQMTASEKPDAPAAEPEEKSATQ